jgi:DNA-binding response OmpR family regulator
LIMITGEGNEEIAAHAFRLGATDYLVKRRNLLTKLLELVAEILSEKGRERNHRSANLNTANSGIELIKKCQEGLNNLDMQTSLAGESVIVEFEKADEFIKFHSHVKTMDGVKVHETKILDKKFILSLFLLPTHFQRIGKVFSV